MRIGITLFLAWVHIPSSGLRTPAGNLAALYDQLSILSRPDPNRSSRHHQCSIPTSIRNKNTRGTFSADSWTPSSPPWLIAICDTSISTRCLPTIWPPRRGARNPPCGSQPGWVIIGSVTPVEQTFAHDQLSSYSSPKGVARLSFTARIGRAPPI